MAKRRTILDQIMNETILYGGLPVTRSFAYTHALSCIKADGITGQKAINLAQLYAFGPNKPAIDVAPMSYEDWVAITGEDFLAVAAA